MKLRVYEHYYQYQRAFIEHMMFTRNYNKYYSTLFHLIINKKTITHRQLEI